MVGISNLTRRITVSFDSKVRDMNRSKSLLRGLAAATAMLLNLSTAGQAQSILDRSDQLPRADERPLESVDGVRTYYESVEVEPGVRLRVLISVPAGSDRALHPILFTQWVSCDTVELGEGSGGSLGAVAKNSGLALVRVERSGTGDSQGSGCDNLDYDTEIQHYISAFTQILDHKALDPSKVYVWGDSLGATTAPLVAVALQNAGRDIAAVAVQGGGALTHFERMLNFDRFYLERRSQEVAAASIHSEMLARVRFHTEYLINQRHPDNISTDSPAMAAVRSDVRGMSSDNHYGRPFSWHQQAAQRNFLAAWATLDAHVLVIFNEYDQFETLHGHRLIVDTVNRLRPDTANLVVQPGLGHSSWRFNSIEEAYRDETGIPETETTAARIVHWLRTLEK